MPKLFTRMVNICKHSILHCISQGVENKVEDAGTRIDTHSQKELELIELGWFRERIASSTAFLRNKEKHKTQKMHLIRQLLQSLHSRGLSHLSSAHHKEQKNMLFILSLPSMEGVTQSLIGRTELAGLWDGANKQVLLSFFSLFKWRAVSDRIPLK